MTYTNVNSLSHIYWLIYCWHWTRVIRWCWHYLICLPHLTVSTTTCYWTGFGGQVHFIFVSPCSARTHIGGLFYTISGSVRNTAGIGPRANPVHRWPAAVGEAPPTDSSWIHGRHSDLRVLPTRRFCRPLRESVRLCRWGFGLDGIQSAAAESRQD